MKQNLNFLIILLTGLILTSLSCKQFEVERVNKVETGEYKNVTPNSADVEVKVIDVGPVITDWGVCYSTSPNPDINSSLRAPENTPAKGTFYAPLYGLTPNTTYYVRAFISGSGGIDYGKEISFATLDESTPYITITAPVETDEWAMGTTQEIKWNDNIDDNVNIELYKGDTKSGDIDLDIANTGTYSWFVPTDLTEDNDYKIKITSATNSSVSATSLAFSITPAGAISIVDPKSNEVWMIGNSATINWTDEISENVNIELFKGSTKVQDIATDVASNEQYTVTTVPSVTVGADYTIKITSVNDNAITAQSPEFIITETTTISISSPTTGNDWKIGNTYDITWTDILSQDVNIELWKAGSKLQDIVSNTANDGTHSWTVPGGLTTASDYQIFISSTYNTTINALSSEFTISEAATTITDYDGNIYNIVTIGDQVWMAENFKGTHDKNGGALTSYVYNDNANSELDTYGRLYTWAEAMKGAPEGWHLPTDEEWKQLEMYLGMSQAEADASGWRGTTEGDKLKETGNTHWDSPSAGTDNFGFTALPGGSKEADNSYVNLGLAGLFWSSTEINSTQTWCRVATNTRTDISRDSPLKVRALSVRYIKDSDKTVQDIDGNIYDVMTIGSQQWMKQNLKTIHYSDGTAIPLVTVDATWSTLGDNNTDKAYCYYDNSDDNRVIYGALYTWAASMNGSLSSTSNPSGVQGACPIGWHVPSDAEWKELEMYLGMSQSEADGTDFRGTNEGSKLAGNASLWIDGVLENSSGFGESGFSALPGGYRRSYDGAFSSVGNNSYWWCSTEGSTDSAWGRSLDYDISKVGRGSFNKSRGRSIRCVKD